MFQGVHVVPEGERGGDFDGVAHEILVEVDHVASAGSAVPPGLQSGQSPWPGSGKNWRNAGCSGPA